MLSFFIRWLINTIALLVVVGIVPGIHAAQWETVFVAALVLGLLNAILKPLILYFTLPLQVFSLGFFTLVINGFILYLVPQLVIGFYVDNFWSAFWGAVFFSIISFFLSLFIGPRQNINVNSRGQKTSSRYEDNIIDVEGRVKDD